MALITFDSSIVSLVCMSDSHNDDCRNHVPAADIFLHAGDMTDDGTLAELEAAFDWIAALPHPVKVVVAGNHDLGLDHRHPTFSQQAHDLFTSAKAKSHNIHYLDRAVLTVANYRDSSSSSGTTRPIQIYGNPCTPDFLKSPYAFTYLPYPDPSSLVPWHSAPKADDGVDIWVMHSPPKGRLDAIPIPPLTGCEVQRRKIAESKPLLCVFGHYHCSYGAERVTWKSGSTTEGEESTIEHVEKLEMEHGKPLDFTAGEERLQRGNGTLLLNAAWMTMEKTKVQKRNVPWLVKLDLR